MVVPADGTGRRAHQARERAAVTLRAIADAVVTVGPDGHINYLNPAARC
ncbi:MAG: hypothetical protein R3D03_14285 [Geminicoccaceae bacterium]